MTIIDEVSNPSFISKSKAYVVLFEKEGLGTYLGLQLKKLSFSQEEIEDSAITEIKKTVETVTKKFLITISEIFNISDNWMVLFISKIEQINR